SLDTEFDGEDGCQVLAANSLDLGWVVVRESNFVLANESIRWFS
ncbi:hypothetical protein A2U01_0057535, partial [Trifolium medium]|nr:hypothetical protein [Trifolium medium]